MPEQTARLPQVRAPGEDAGGALLEVRGLTTHYFTDEGVVRAVDGVDFSLRRGTTLCVVGESGSGKSVTARSILQLVDAPGRIVAGEIVFRPTPDETIDITRLGSRGPGIRKIRGRQIAMIFQEPMSSLSGGMRQRAMIAMALSCGPKLLIADEPTTALDVTTQAGILDLIRDIQEETGMAVLFITHDLGVVAEVADDVVVMYLGTVAERGDVDSIFHDPKHPYTRALLRSIPRLGIERVDRLVSIRGMVPHPFDRPNGCPFHPRCDAFMPAVCDRIMPPLETLGEDREVRCLLHSDVEALTQGGPT